MVDPRRVFELGHSPCQPVLWWRRLSRAAGRSTWRVRASLPTMCSRLRRADGLQSPMSRRRAGLIESHCSRSTKDTGDHRLSPETPSNQPIVPHPVASTHRWHWGTCHVSGLAQRPTSKCCRILNLRGSDIRPIRKNLFQILVSFGQINFNFISVSVLDLLSFFPHFTFSSQFYW